MIDLRFPLPAELVVGGRGYAIDTGFRTWLEVSRSVADEGFVPASIFAGEVPEGDWGDAAVEFLRSENATPHGGGGAGAEALDLIRDGDYLVGAFWQAYGIDLTTAELHWHVFLALLRSLPEGCRLVDIMGYRSWRKSDARRKPDSRYAELRRMWALPPKADAAIIEWQREAFGNIEV